MVETIAEEVMSLKDIETQFDGEWVLIEDPYLDDRRQVAGGKLLFHSKIRDEVYQTALRLQPKHSAFFYMGAMPDGVALNL